MNIQPIGVLDSGFGGLSIWKEIIKYLPSESTVYVADSLNCPYGNRPKEKIYMLSYRLIQFLLKKKVKLVVLACNTITVSCLDRFRAEFTNVPIIGTVPVVKTAAEQTRNKCIGIFSTTQTAKSKYQKDLIKKFANDCQVINLGTDKLVPFIEKGEIDNKKFKTMLRKELSSLVNTNIDILALGCSHFPFIKAQIKETLGDGVEILDSGGAIARQVKRVLDARNELSAQNNPSHELYTTGDGKEFQRTAEFLIGEEFYGKIQQIKYVKI